MDDNKTRLEMANLYRAGLAKVQSHYLTPAGPANESGYQIKDRSGFDRLTTNLERVPILVVPAYLPRYELLSTFGQATTWGSILPAVWSFMLALRSRGLGSVWTTVHLHFETQMADLLGIPAGYLQAGLFPVAYTIGSDFKPADREFSNRRVFWNRWTVE